jgi:hypothetical protein
MRTLSRNKAAGSRVSISNEHLTRQWRKYFGTSKEKLEAAVAKVGGNPETVQKELRALKT